MAVRRSPRPARLVVRVSLPPVVSLLLLLSPPAFSDAGMWTFHDFPRDLVKRQYGADISSAWLDRVRSATLRLSNCTASFVSPAGLILTNHHCAEGCLDEHSTSEQNLLRGGFLARSREQELKCGTQIADVLMSVENVTDRVAAAIRGLDDRAANDTRKKTLTQLEQACEQESQHARSGPLKCESVDLYQGGQYWLYKYHRYDDVRLVFAPERGIAAFGGDPDNFQFPRWCLDMALLRAYGPNGKPAATPSFLALRPEGPQAGELVFVSGHPGTADRLLTVAQLETLRDVELPRWLLRASELRGRFIQFAKTGAEADRIVEDPLNGLENSIKVRRKQLDALLDERLLNAKRDEEAALRARVAADPQLAAATGDPWTDIAKAQLRERELYLPYTFLEAGAGFNSRLFNYARTLVRGAAERPKPNTERLREYRDAALARIAQRLSAPVPLYPALDTLTLSFALERMREWLGPDDPIVRALLAKDSPDALAARLVDSSQLADPKLRQRLWDGGAAALEAAHDPMIEFARRVDAPARAVRKSYEDEVEAPVDAAAEKIARARFRVYGTSVPPDATFTLRLNVGTVQGWKEDGHEVEPFTHLARLFERATGEEPFRIPDSWLRVQGALDRETRFDLSTSNDIVGGNSGSPLIDTGGRLVGLMFDGNIHSIAGSFWFDPGLNRAVAVDPAIMFEALRKVYQADGLLAELGRR
ncbi:MAG: S46 family peptidase [Gammaproteobacteria bacterium]|nr:MAG: S46 family peptidase [Gammaproteobacteria bacterium]